MDMADQIAKTLGLKRDEVKLVLDPEVTVDELEAELISCGLARAKEIYFMSGIEPRLRELAMRRWKQCVDEQIASAQSSEVIRATIELTPVLYLEVARLLGIRRMAELLGKSG